jgi:hypothetical protein
MVITIEWLSADPIIDTLNKYFGLGIPKKASVSGRIARVGSGVYGLQVRFDNMPGGITIPPIVSAAGISAELTRFRLDVGAVRRVRKNIVHRVTTQGLNGPMVVLIHDHILVGHHLFSRPRACPGGGMWPWQIQVGFPEGLQAISGRVHCHP